MKKVALEYEVKDQATQVVRTIKVTLSDSRE